MCFEWRRLVLPLELLSAVILPIGSALAQPLRGAIFTTNSHGTAVNANIYQLSADVYVSGGPPNQNFPGLPDGTYYFQVTDPSGSTILSSDNAVCRQLRVTNGVVAGATSACHHANGIFNAAN